MIIWLASYPKSGNTWLRSIISALLFTEDGLFNFKLIYLINSIDVNRYIEYYIDDQAAKISKYKISWITYTKMIYYFLKSYEFLCT